MPDLMKALQMLEENMPMLKKMAKESYGEEDMADEEMDMFGGEDAIDMPAEEGMDEFADLMGEEDEEYDDEMMDMEMPKPKKKGKPSE